MYASRPGIYEADLPLRRWVPLSAVSFWLTGEHDSQTFRPGEARVAAFLLSLDPRLPEKVRAQVEARAWRIEVVGSGVRLRQQRGWGSRPGVEVRFESRRARDRALSGLRNLDALERLGAEFPSVSVVTDLVRRPL